MRISRIVIPTLSLRAGCRDVSNRSRWAEVAVFAVIILSVVSCSSVKPTQSKFHVKFAGAYSGMVLLPENPGVLGGGELTIFPRTRRDSIFGRFVIVSKTDWHGPSGIGAIRGSVTGGHVHIELFNQEHGYKDTLGLILPYREALYQLDGDVRPQTDSKWGRNDSNAYEVLINEIQMTLSVPNYGKSPKATVLLVLDSLARP